MVGLKGGISMVPLFTFFKKGRIKNNVAGTKGKSIMCNKKEGENV